MVTAVGFAGATANAVEVLVPWEHYGTSDPIEIEPGDVGILAWNGSIGNTWTPPDGWDLAAPEVIGSTGSHRSRIYVRELTGDEADEPIVLTASEINKMMGMLIVLRDVDTSAIIDAINFRDEDTTGTSHANPSITTVADDAPVFVIIHERLTNSSTNYGAPPGYIKRLQPVPVGGGGSVSGAVADDGLAVSRPGGTLVTPPPWTGGESTNNVITWTFSVTPRTSQDESGTGSISAAAAVTGGGTKGGAGTGSITAAAALSGDGEADLPPSGTGSITAAAALSGTGVKAAAGIGAAAAAAAVTGAGAKGASGTGSITAAAALSGAGTGELLAPPAFPDAPLDVLVELLIDGVWTDITEDVYLRDEIEISRGRADEAPRADPAELSLTLNNRSGKYSARNPLSPLYGKIGRNTPIRVSVKGKTVDDEEWQSVRVVAEVSSWPPKWDVSGEDRYVPITAAGILRRLGQGQKPLRSALYRSIAGAAPYTAWWPLEDGPRAHQAASGYAGQPPARLVGDAKMTDTPSGGVAGGVEITETGRVSASVTGGTADWVVCCWMDVPANIADEDATPFLQWRTPGALLASQWDLVTAGGFGGVLVLTTVDHDNQVINTMVGSIDIRGRGPVQVVVAGHQEGGLVRVESWVDGVPDIVGGTAPDFPGPVTAIGLNSSIDTSAGTRYAGTISHLLVAPYSRLADVLSHADAGGGYVGETAAARAERIGAEEGIPVEIIGDPDESAPMGPQQPLTPLELLEDCANADGGTLSEQREALGLRYRIRAQDYNTDPDLVLDYAAGDIAPPLEPVEDDQGTRNDVTASRPGGSSAQVVVEEGPLSIQPPPAGVGRYDEAVTVNVAADEQLLDVAGWRAHLGTWDEARFPTVPINLAAAPHLIPDVIELDSRTHVRLVNLPDEVPPGPVDLFVNGYTEVLGDFDWDLTFNASPARPWTVGVIEDDVLGHVDTDGSELADAVGPTDTQISVTVTAGPLWTLDPADLPFDVIMGGEIVTVTAISGTSNPQTFTVSRALNGVVKAHDAGTDVRLAHPAIVAR